MSDMWKMECFRVASEAAGRKLTFDELEQVFERARTRINNYVRQGMSNDDAAARAGAELANEQKYAVAVEKRSAKMNLIVQRSIEARTVVGRERDSVMSLITGFEKDSADFKNAGLSADAVGIDNVGTYLGPMTNELEAAGLLKPLMKGNRQFGRDIANELGRLSDPTWGKATGNKFAAAAAKIIYKYQEGVRLEQNKWGAWIGKLEQYITRQSHDADLIRGNGSPAAFKKWRDLIVSKLDLDKTFRDVEPADQDSWLFDVWTALSTGVHEGATGSDWLSGFKGPSNLAKKVSQERKLFFKSADDWSDYNEVFGHGDVRSALLHQIEHGARNAAMMRVLGTNPTAMLDGYVARLIDMAKKRGDVNQAADLAREAGKYSSILDYAMRKGTGSEVPTFTKVMATIRSIQDFKLGGFLSYLSDLGTIQAAARHAGINPLEALGNQVAGLLPQGAERHAAALELGQGADGFTSSLNARMRAYDGTFRGRMASLASTFEKWNGVKWWVQSQKEAFGRMLSGNLARLADQEFADLAPRLQTTLRRYGIEQPEWDAGRQVATRMIDGHDYLFPADIHNLPDSAFDAFTAGNKSQAALDRAKADLVSKFSTFITDQVRVGMSEPTAGISRMILGNKQKSTVIDELRRAFFQFKTFPMTHVMRSLSREWMRDGKDLGGIAGLLASTSALGYVAYSLKKLTRGQEPAPFNDPTAGNIGKAIFAGIAQGGGLGLYGDFLFGESSRFGGGPLEEALGPTFNSAAQLAKMTKDDVQDAMSGKLKRNTLGVQAINLIKSNAPMVNLWYARGALDYLILYSLQETMNPGYLKRYEKQLKDTQGVNFVLSPSQSHVHTFGR